MVMQYNPVLLSTDSYYQTLSSNGYKILWLETLTHIQTNPFSAEEATIYFSYCAWLLLYDYLLYITYVTSTFVTEL